MLPPWNKTVRVMCHECRKHTYIVRMLTKHTQNTSKTLYEHSGSQGASGTCEE
jgi:hypothetical protein